MTDAHTSSLQRALSTRLCLQISVSALPVVEEWMDANLSRWLDSVPLPPELPSGTMAQFRVSIASDLSRLGWSAHGPPRGFVPKMSDYLEKCGIGPGDLALINELGGKLEPELVGSWVRVVGGEVRTGWQFCEVQPLLRLVPQLGRQEATTALLAWVASQSVVEFRRFIQAIGDEAFSEIDLVLPGDTAADQLGVAATAVKDLLGETLPDYVAKTMSACTEADLSAIVRIGVGGIESVGVCSSRAGMDTAAQLCSDAGVAYDNQLAQLEGALQADGVERLEYRAYAGSSPPQIEVHFVPGVLEKAPDLDRN